jgi:hypothetical protein
MHREEIPVTLDDRVSGAAGRTFLESVPPGAHRGADTTYRDRVERRSGGRPVDHF